LAETYDQLYAAAEAFEEYVLDRLAEEWGIRLARTATFEEQRTWGDTRILEIKFDRLFERTGNLCIETHERPSRPGTRGVRAWVDSGIRSDSAAFLYGIGNRTEFFVFSRRTLADFVARDNEIAHYETSTSRGVLIKRSEAAALAEACYLWTDPTT